MHRQGQPENHLCAWWFPSSSWSCQCPCGCGNVVKRHITSMYSTDESTTQRLKFVLWTKPRLETHRTDKVKSRGHLRAGCFWKALWKHLNCLLLNRVLRLLNIQDLLNVCQAHIHPDDHFACWNRRDRHLGHLLNARVRHLVHLSNVRVRNEMVVAQLTSQVCEPGCKCKQQHEFCLQDRTTVCLRLCIYQIKTAQDGPAVSDFVLAESSVTSPRKLFIFIVKLSRALTDKFFLIRF